MKKSPPSKAPTGRKTTAQGKEPRDAALGPPPPQNPSPEGAAQMPVGWEACRFDAVAQVISGKNQKKVESSSGVYPIYGSGGTFGRATSYLCEPGTTVVGRKGTINSPIFVNERFWNVDTAFGLFPLKCDTLIPRFLYYFCRLFDFTSLDKSTTIPSLAKRDIEAITIPLPPLAEQRQIVAKIEELFSELDAGEESLRRARRQLGVYRQSLLKQAFEGKLTEPWHKQNPNLTESPDQLLKRIQAERQARYEEQLIEWEAAVRLWEDTGENGKRPPKPKFDSPTELPANSSALPKEWVWVNLGVLKQFSLYGPRFSSDDYSDDGVCVLRTSDIGESGKVNLATAPRLRLTKVEQYLYGCQKGDLLITRTGSLGTLAVFNGDVDSIPGAYLIQYRLVAALYATFVYHFLRGPVGQSALTGGGAGVGRPNLNAPTIEAIPIPLCSLPEQREIVRLLDEQFTVIEQNERELDAALKRSAALRQFILKKAFTGQLVPQDPTDEPASTLLERIREEREIKPAKHMRHSATR